MALVVCITSHQEYSHLNAASQVRSSLELSLAYAMKHALSWHRYEAIPSGCIDDGQPVRRAVEIAFGSHDVKQVKNNLLLKG